FTTGKHDQVGIAHPVGGQDDNFVAGIKRRDGLIVEDLFASGANDDLARPVVEAVLALELPRYRRLELRNAVHGGVLGRLAALDGLNRRALDVFGGVEVRLPRPEPYDIPACGFERTRLVGDGDGSRRFDAVEGL